MYDSIEHYSGATGVFSLSLLALSILVSFWMKDMKFSIDIIWLDVLETVAGFVQKNKLT